MEDRSGASTTGSELVFNDAREPSPSMSEVEDAARWRTIRLEEVDPPPRMSSVMGAGAGAGGPFAWSIGGMGTAGSNVSVIEEEEEGEYEDDESEDDGDVFAYLPPTTADLPPSPLPGTATMMTGPTPNANAFPYLHRHPQLPTMTLPVPYPPIDPKPVESPPQTNSTDDADRDIRDRFPTSSSTGNSVFRMRSLVPGSKSKSKSKTSSSKTSSRTRRLPRSQDRDIYTATTAKSTSPPLSPLSSRNTASATEGSIKMEFDFDNLGIGGEEEEDSVYPEVRASVSNMDDPDMPALTFRMWIIGLFLSIITGAANVFFWFRNPAPSFGPLIALLLSYPLGKFLAYILPIRTFKFPSLTLPPHGMFGLGSHRVIGRYCTFGAGKTVGGWEIGVNPGPWNIKEHVLCYIMANVTVVPPYAMSMIVVSELYYNIKRGFGFNLLLTFATQLTGFGLAGLCRRFLVWPASMVWPQTLVVCTLLNTLHAEDDMDMDLDMDVGVGVGVDTVGTATVVPVPLNEVAGVQPKRAGWKRFIPHIPFISRRRPPHQRRERRYRSLTRYKFFLLISLFSFFWFFLPGFLFTGLSIFSWVCWITPRDVVVNQLFGVASGLGMGVVTFDWTEISWIGSPLAVPWWAEVHVFLGFVLVYWVLTPVMYYTNVWDLSYFPMSDTLPYDRFGGVYNVTRVLTPSLKFNATAYDAYSPLYLPATYAMTYLLAFALSTCVIVHTIIYHGRSLLNGVKKIRVEPDDIHAKLMRNYPEVPDWWYGAVFLGFFGMAILLVEVWHTGIPVYMLALSLVLPIVYVLPSGFIYAMTGQSINLNVLAQIIPGSILPGNPLVNMIFKCYSIQTLSEALSFVQDLKLGHYIKVPPRATFIVQLVATVLASVMQIGVKEWMFANVKDICQPGQRSQLTCPHNSVFFTASAIWGLIGPSRQFGSSSIYHPQLYALIIGAFLPIPFWLWQRRFPNTRLKYVSIPVLINGIGFIPPATGINYSSWFAVGFVFQYLIRRRNFAWWSKFNYVLSAGLDCGTLVSILAIFFFLQWPRGGVEVNWWGNLVWQNTADAMRTPLRLVPDGGIPLRT